MSFDFRSDTVTRPTAEMLQAMMNAPTGDDVFGDDPTVNALEAEVAAMLGKDAALFVPSGTMSNQLALRVHVGALDEVLCDHRAHIHVWEAGGIHALSGASVAAAAPSDGRFLSADDVSAHTRLDHCLYHQPVTRLLALENTLNGSVSSAVALAAAAARGAALGLATHLDGARLWNAAAASGAEPAEFAAPFDTVSVCLSKGLGAPVGSVLAGRAELIGRARHFRKMYGGGWRQAGLLAAAGRHALRHHRGRLTQDHEAAQCLADGLSELGFQVEPPETNMVWCNPPERLRVPFEEVQRSLAPQFLLGGAYQGPRGRNPWGSGSSLRFVTHMQTPISACKALIGALRKVIK
ncbi:hypothetical protein AB1Y20_010853 [Prymnesium parvum]|uniref:Aromatic amino acid beta-eliminating lyase/threonine aldolase domain-containing protein n=1 Tax=Prymnesium parvum TaxID=97485 RepID=A0AB34IQG7_PRYPA